MGRTALNLLIDLIEKKETVQGKQQKIVLDPILISRDSSTGLRN